MKTINKIIFAFTLFVAFTTAKAQNAYPTSTGKNTSPKVLVNSVVEKEVAVTSIQKPMQEQVIDNAKMKKRSEDYTKAEEVLTQEQKKQHDEDSAKANAKIEEMTNNRQRGY